MNGFQTLSEGFDDCLEVIKMPVLSRLIVRYCYQLVVHPSRDVMCAQIIQTTFVHNNSFEGVFIVVFMTTKTFTFSTLFT